MSNNTFAILRRKAKITDVNVPDSKWPLCRYFLSGYLSSKAADPENFPPDQFPEGFDRYEAIFGAALQTLGLTKEALKSKSEFNFDSGNAANLEGGIGILRAVEALRLAKFTNITFVTPKKGSKGADIVAEKNNRKVCFEIKTITKQSSGRGEFFIADQLREKILESLPTARKQLAVTAEELQCTVKLFVCVVNWFDQSIYLGQGSLQQIINRLEKDEREAFDGPEIQESLKGIDGVWFIMRMGHHSLFLNEVGKYIDS